MKAMRTLLLVTVLSGSAAAAHAQTLDYGRMEALFDEPVTASATGSPLRRSEVPATMDIITAEDIRRSGATTIPEILSRLAGISLYTWSKNSADVAVRGLNQGASNRLLVMVDGHENYVDAFGTVVWEYIPVQIDEIRQIEVVKGPSSALYGFNAAAGVVNIITFNPAYDDTRSERLTLGTDGTQQGSVVQTAHWDGGGVRASAGWSKLTESQYHPPDPGNRAVTSDPSITRTASFDAQTRLGPSAQLRWQESLSDGGFRMMANRPAAVVSTVVMSQLDLSASTAVGLLDAVVMNNHNQSRFTESVGSAKFDNDVTVVKLQDLFKLDAADTVRLGGEYRRDTMPTLPIAGGDLVSQTASLSGMWDHAFTPALSWLNALRGDRFWLERSGSLLAGSPYGDADYDRAIYGLSFNSTLVYHPSEVDTVRLAVARGLQLPSLTEFGAMESVRIPFAPPRIPTATLNLLGNPDLRPSKVMHYELSEERRLPALDGSARIALYHQVVTDLRDTVGPTLVRLPPAPLALATYQNVGGVHLNGVEAELKGRLAPAWRWSANYTYEVVSDDTAAGRLHDFDHSTPRHMANASLGRDWRSWQADGFVRYVSRTQMITQTSLVGSQLLTIEPVWAFSQRVSYDVNPQLRLQVVATSGFADNPLSSEKHRVLFSLIARY